MLGVALESQLATPGHGMLWRAGESQRLPPVQDRQVSEANEMPK